MNKKEPFFSIIIPTRNRHKTLFYSIKTVLNQYFSDFELIICDNNSSPETQELVSSFDNNKIKYIRSDIDLAMTDNWELAISKATGTYIIVFGDDDGIMPYALKDLYFILNETKAKVIRWDRVYYSWPCIIVEDAKNKLSIPIKIKYKTNYIDGTQIIAKIANGDYPYELLPMFYNSVIHKDLISKAKATSNRIFHSQIPDVYSGYLFAYLGEKYLSIDKPMTINGGSAKSNGTATLYAKKDNKVSKEFNSLYYNKSKLSFHSSMPNVKSLPVFTTEPFMQLKEIYNLDDQKFKIDKKRVLKNIVNGLKTFDKEDWDNSIKIISKTVYKDKNLNKWFINYANKIKPKFISKIIKKRTLFDGQNLSLDASKFGITNVYDVSLFVNNMLEKQNINLKIENKIYKKIYKRIRNTIKVLIYGKL